jgi:hypothetical protein
LERELAYLDNGAMIVPEALPLAVETISRRLEAEILTTELPRLGEAVENDCAAGYFGSDAAKCFASRCREVTTAGAVLPDQLRDVLSICEIGKERLEREIGTDRLSAVATQTLAVAVSSMGSQARLLAAAGKLLAMLRVPALLFYVFARDAQYRSRTGVAVNAAVLAAGVVILLTQAIAAHEPYNGWFVGLGITAIVGPSLLGALRWPGIARKIAAVLAVVVLAFVVAVLFRIVPLPGAAEAWQSIAAVSVA